MERQMACLQVLDSLLRATKWDCLQCTHTNGVCGTFQQGVCFSCIQNKMFYWHWSVMFPDPVQLTADWGCSLSLWFRSRNNWRAWSWAATAPPSAWSCTQWASWSKTGLTTATMSLQSDCIRQSHSKRLFQRQGSCRDNLGKALHRQHLQGCVAPLGKGQHCVLCSLFAIWTT